VNDLVADVDRGTELRERLFDDRDRTIDACAEAARICEEHLHCVSLAARAGPSPRRRRLSKIRIAAPMVIALAATLNAGNAHPAWGKRRKSTTLPITRRS